jgi:hypothetical protein
MKSAYLHLLFLLLVAGYIFYFKYLPLQDFPQWIYHGHVFNQMVFHGNDFGGFFSFHHYIPPNSCATAIIGLFELVMSPIIAGKLFLLISLVMIYFGSWKVLKSLTNTEHPLFTFISFAACFNLFFYGGFLNFLFGLGISLLGISYLLKHRTNSNPFVLSAFFLLCYFSHFASLLILIIPVAAIIIHDRNLVFMRKITFAMVPTIILFLHYYFTKELRSFSPEGITISNYFESLLSDVLRSPAAIKPFHRIKFIYELPDTLDIVNYAFVVTTITGALYFAIRVMLKRNWSLLSVIGLTTLVLVVFSPRYLGGLFVIGQRFAFFLWLVLIAYYFISFPSTRIRMAETIIICLLSFSSFVVLWYSTGLFNGLNIPAHQIEASSHDGRGGSNPFEGFHFYNDIQENRAVPVFHSGILDYRGAQNEKPFDQ